MTTPRAIQLEEMNNELITVLRGLVTRCQFAVQKLEGDNWAVLLTTFQAEELLKRVSPMITVCSNPNCVDGLAPRKTGSDDGDGDMEPCPVCGGPGS